MRLVDNARKAWTWLSMWFFAAIGFSTLLWEGVGPEVLSVIPAEWQPYVVASMAIMGGISRLVKQGDSK